MNISLNHHEIPQSPENPIKSHEYPLIHHFPNAGSLWFPGSRVLTHPDALKSPGRHPAVAPEDRQELIEANVVPLHLTWISPGTYHI